MPKQVNGWHLPMADGYFTKFVKGVPPKQNGFQRDHLLEALAFVRNWRVAIDVGAHVGFWTVDMCDKFDQVIAFEPHPETYECLCLNTADWPNLTLTNAAVGAERGWCEITGDPGKRGEVNTGSYYVDPNAEAGKIPVMPLDELKLEVCDFLKIDVEGYEYQVLQGAETLIRKRRPVVIMETDKQWHRRYGMGKFASHNFLIDRGYKAVAHLRPDTIFAPL